jgi:hypothetical protein
MSKLAQRLADPARSGVYRVSSADTVEEVVRGTPLSCTRVALHGGKAQVLDALASALAFPDWFGRNWDALEDCLADLSWKPAGGHLLLLAGAPALPRDDAGILTDILASSAEAWKARGKPFFAVLVDPARELKLPDLYREG